MTLWMCSVMTKVILFLVVYLRLTNIILEKSILGLSERTPSNDYSLGYTSDELIGFLADDDPDFYPIFNSAQSQSHTHIYPAPNYHREQHLHHNHQTNGLGFNSVFDSHSIDSNNHFQQHQNPHQHHSNGSITAHFQSQSQNSQMIDTTNDIIPPNSNGDLSISSCSTTISQQPELHNIAQQDGVNKNMFDFSTMARNDGIQEQVT